MSAMPTDYIAEAITEAYGERCPDFAEGCACCEAWRQYDALTSALIDKAVVEAIGALRVEQPGRAYDILSDALEAATALRLSAGGGWRTMDSAPHGVNVLLAYWDEALGGWHMEAGMASWGWRRGGVSNMSAHGQATHWQPLPSPPASPTVEGA